MRAFPKPSEIAKRPRQKPSHVTKDGRYILSLTDWKKLKDWLWNAHITIFGLVRCHICKGTIQSKYEYEPDHITPRGNGGCYRDDRYVKPSHTACNRLKGSRRLPS